VARLWEAWSVVRVVTACFYCDTTSTVVTHLREAVTLAWMVTMATVKSAGATLVAVEVMAMIGGGVAMIDLGQVWVGSGSETHGPSWR
jgi:hypothetical protein